MGKSKTTLDSVKYQFIEGESLDLIIDELSQIMIKHNLIKEN